MFQIPKHRIISYRHFKVFLNRVRGWRIHTYTAALNSRERLSDEEKKYLIKGFASGYSACKNDLQGYAYSFLKGENENEDMQN